LKIYPYIDSALFQAEMDGDLKNKRLEMEDIFASFVKILSYRSSCAKTRQAAILVKENRILSIGYNGSPSGAINCLLEGGESACGKDESGSCFYGVHAEQNCLGYAVRNGIETEDCTMYVTMSPCINCAKLITASGISEYLYIDGYRKDEGLKFLTNTNVKVRQLSVWRD
jgi:dCMP deaminase